MMTFDMLMRRTVSAKVGRRLQALVACVVCPICHRRCVSRRTVPVAEQAYAAPRGRRWRTYQYACPCGTIHEFNFSGGMWACSMTRDFMVKRAPWRSTYYVNRDQTVFAPLDEQGKPRNDAAQALPGFIAPERFAALLPFT